MKQLEQLRQLRIQTLTKIAIVMALLIPVHITAAPKIPQNSIIKTAKKYLGTKYRYGASSKTTSKFDCSSFVQRVFKTHGKNLPRTSNQQASSGKHINKKNLKIGDLVFFSDSRRRIGHVGIFIGKGKFIHASSTAKKVIISNLDKKYYKRKYIGARRVN